MAAPQPTHVIELASPAFIRPRYVRRETHGGGFVTTTDHAKARRYAPSAAAKAAATLTEALAAAGYTPTVLPFSSLQGQQ